MDNNYEIAFILTKVFKAQIKIKDFRDIVKKIEGFNVNEKVKNDIENMNKTIDSIENEINQIEGIMIGDIDCNFINNNNNIYYVKNKE